MTDEPDLVLAVITRLKADTAVAAVTGTRIYRKGDAPKVPTYPYIEVSEVSDVGDDDTSTSAYASARIQCTCLATSSDRAASQLSKKARRALHRITSTVLPAGAGSVYVISILDAGDGSDMNADIPLFMYYRDFAVRYNY